MLTQKQIALSITSIGRRSATLRNDIHEVCCNLVGHAVDHGDVTLADRLLAAAGSGARAQAIVTWLETFGPFQYAKDKDTGARSFKLRKEARHEMAQAHNGAAHVDALLKGVTWFDYTKESVKSAYDVESVVASLIKTAKAKADKGEEVKNAGLVLFLSDAIAAYHRKAA